jgi:hypothetical protein
VKLRIIASTIPVGHGGAGDYLSQIAKAHADHILIAPRLANRIKNPQWLQITVYAFEVLAIKAMLHLLTGLRLIRAVVIHHPQSLGYWLTWRLIRNSEQVDYWVLDASFFCKQSYNHHDQQPCTRCLKTYDPYQDCRHFPNRFVAKGTYLKYRASLQEHAEKIVFHVQTDSYVRLLSEGIAVAKTIRKDKMLVPSFYTCTFWPTGRQTHDFLFHANPVSAKGFDYFLALAGILKHRSFFVPSKRSAPAGELANVSFEDVNWNSGLQDRIAGSKVVLCPSLWSAPVEAAVVKSFLLGKPVGLVESVYSLANELPEGCFIPLTGDAAEDAAALERIVSDAAALERIAAAGRDWAERYIAEGSGRAMPAFTGGRR